MALRAEFVIFALATWLDRDRPAGQANAELPALVAFSLMGACILTALLDFGPAVSGETGGQPYPVS
jgi:hypothetical protein